jgi:DNA anti-recombination protein RmuC
LGLRAVNNKKVSHYFCPQDHVPIEHSCFLEALTNVKLDLKSDLKHLEANFSEALGKFSEAFVQHLQTELKKVTDKFDSLCTEIKSSSKMVIKDQSKDPANVVQEIQNRLRYE